MVLLEQIRTVNREDFTRVLIHEKSSLAPPGETMAFKLGDEEGFRWVGAYEISADELLDGKAGKQYIRAGRVYSADEVEAEMKQKQCI